MEKGGLKEGGAPASSPVGGGGGGAPVKRTLNLVAFISIAFQLTAGGPSGSELSVIYGGPAATFAGLLLLPLVWGLPQALVTAELATHYPANGGPIIWLREAYGDLGAWLLGLNSMVSSLLDTALYPLLFADSLALAAGGLSPLQARLAAWALTAVAVGLNVRGLALVSRASAVLSVVVLAPYALAFVAQLPAIASGGRAWAQPAPSPRWDVWLASMLWSFSGYDATGSLAGEVIRPEVTYVRGLLVTMGLASLSYGIPLLTAIQTHPDVPGTWRTGVLQQFVGDVHPLLGSLATAAALLSQLGMMTAGLSASSRAVWALAGGGGASATSPAGAFPTSDRAPSSSGSSSSSPSLAVAHLPRVLATEVAGTPVAALAVHGVAVALLVTLPFESLLSVNLLLGALRVLLIAAAFLRLRGRRSATEEAAASASAAVDKPHVSTVYRVPGGWAGATLAALPLVAVSAWFLSIAQYSSVRPAVVINAAGLVVFGLRAWADRRRYGVWWPRGRWNLAPPSLHAPRGGHGHHSGGGGFKDSNADSGTPDSYDDEGDDDGGSDAGGGSGAVSSPSAYDGAGTPGGAAARGTPLRAPSPPAPQLDGASSPRMRLGAVGAGASDEEATSSGGGVGIGGDVTAASGSSRARRGSNLALSSLTSITAPSVAAGADGIGGGGSSSSASAAAAHRRVASAPDSAAAAAAVAGRPKPKAV
jgi:amino acid transporter